MRRDQTTPVNAPPAGPTEVRAVLTGAREGEGSDSIWVDVVEGGFRLQHDYPDLHPAAGWTLATGGRTYSVTGVDGRTLTCTTLEG